MTVKIGAVVLHVSDVRRAREFWCGALGYEAAARNPTFLRPVDGVGVELHLDDDDAGHLDLWALDADDLDGEVERLVGLGATRVPEWHYPPGADFVVLRDTEGNLFCVVQRDR